MKKKKTFLKGLMQGGHLHLRQKEVAIFNVVGNYGNYQVKIGPMSHHARSIEVNGRVHHLFASGNHVQPLPTHEEINRNLKGTVVMNDVAVQLFDRTGKGFHVTIKHPKTEGAHPRESINLGGVAGKKMMENLERSGRLADEAYQIIQEDILKNFNA